MLVSSIAPNVSSVQLVRCWEWMWQHTPPPITNKERSRPAVSHIQRRWNWRVIGLTLVTGCPTYSATTKKSCQFIHYVFEIWIKTFTIFINKNFSSIRNSWQNAQQQFLKMTSFPLCSCHNSVSVARVAAHWVPALPITDHRADVPCCQRMSDLSMSLV